MKFRLHCSFIVCLVLMFSPAAPVSAEEVRTAPAQAIDIQRNLYQVAPGLYRSSQPERGDLAVLQRLNIRTIINLRHFDRDDDRERLGNADFTFVNQPMLAWSVHPRQVAAALYAIENAQKNGPVLVHCQHGADRTGIVIGMYRIIKQNWTADEARREMTEGPFGFHSTWRNLRDFYTPENIAAVTAELARLRHTAQPSLD